MTLNTPPKGHKNGSNLKGLGSLAGWHSHQTSALLSISGNISRKDSIATYERPAKGVWDLWERIGAEWGKIEVEECQKLIEGMPRRLEAVIQAKGGHTKY